MFKPGDLCYFYPGLQSGPYLKYKMTEVEVLRPIKDDRLRGGEGFEVQAHDGARFLCTNNCLDLLIDSGKYLLGDWDLVALATKWARRRPTKEERIKYGKVQADGGG